MLLVQKELLIDQRVLVNQVYFHAPPAVEVLERQGHQNSCDWQPEDDRVLKGVVQVSVKGSEKRSLNDVDREVEEKPLLQTEHVFFGVKQDGVQTG